MKLFGKSVDKYKEGKSVSKLLAKVLLVLVGIMFLTGTALAQDADFIMLGSAAPPPYNTTVYDSSGIGGTALPQGCVLEFIYTGADGLIDPPDAAGLPTDDDVIAATAAVGDGTALDGTFLIALVGLIDNAQIYVRAWDANTVAGASNYGDSAIQTMSGPPSPPDSFVIADFATTNAKPGAGPVITLLTPNSGPIGQTVVIDGSGFGATQSGSPVTFNGVDAGVATAWSDTQITIDVPAGTTTGPVVVTVGGNPSNGVTFTVTAPPGGNPPVISNVRFDGVLLQQRTTQPWDYISNRPTITATVTDDGTVDTSSLVVTIGGFIFDYPSYNPASFTYVGTTMQLDIPLTLGDGTYLVTIDARDNAGQPAIPWTTTVIVGAGGPPAVGGGPDPIFNVPNPFDPATGSTNISYNLTADANIEIYIHDMATRVIWYQFCALGTEGGHVGFNQVSWNGREQFGNEIVANGAYVVSIIDKDRRQVLGRGKILVSK